MSPPLLANCPQLVLATTNAHKIAELRELLHPAGIPIKALSEFKDVPHVMENGRSLRENAAIKATQYAKWLNAWVLADDTGLEVAALDGRPGVRSARYAGEHATSAENRAKLIAELQPIPESQRQAQFVCWLTVADPSGDLVAEAQGICRGRMILQPEGTGGIGYDSIFVVAPTNKTLASHSPDEVLKLGHRGLAARNLLAAIVEQD